MRLDTTAYDNINESSIIIDQRRMTKHRLDKDEKDDHNRRVPRDSCLGVHEGSGIHQEEDLVHTNQSLLLGGMLALAQWSGSGEVSRHGCDPCSSKLNRHKRLGRREFRGMLGVGRGWRRDLELGAPSPSPYCGRQLEQELWMWW